MKVLSDQCLFIFAKISYFFRSENSIIYTILSVCVCDQEKNDCACLWKNCIGAVGL